MRIPSPATSLSLIALFVALGGTGYAVTQIDKNSVGKRQLKKNAVTSPKVKDGSLKAIDFAAGQLPAGIQGPKGDAGPQGPAGPATGAAGGALTGSYPNPGLAPASVGADHLATVPAARLRSSTNQPAGTISFDVEDYDTAGMHDDAQPTRLTITRSGLYHLEASSTLGVATNETVLAGGIGLNGVTTLAADNRRPVSGANVNTISASTDVRLTAGDFLTFFVFGAGAIAGTGGDTNSPVLSARWVGP